MQRFDSAKVEIQLRPSDVERLMDGYFGTFSDATPAQITELALAYADHSRVCALLADGWTRLAWPIFVASLLVTDIEPEDCLHFGDAPIIELERRFAVATTALEHV